MNASTKQGTPAASSRTNGADLKRALSWVLSGTIFDEVKLHGNVTWKPVALVQLAVFWMWSAEPGLKAAADAAIQTVIALYGASPVGSYQALVKVLKSYTGQLLPLLWCRLHNLMEQCNEEKWRVGLWLALAMDGSRLSAPRTARNEQRFCKPAQSKKKSKKHKKRSRHAKRKRSTARQKSHYAPQAVGPQMWLTMLWHVGQSLPWSWKAGPSYSSERTHVLEMLREQKFPENTLFCGDAGFVGYDFWQAIRACDQHFLVRVGANVRLLKRLGYVREYEGLVYCWPDAACKKKRPPLVLRLLRFQDRRGDVYLVTSVLDKKALTDRQASEIYRRRWGIELQFRALKQTYHRSKLRSRSPECAEIELHWSLIGLWMIQLLALKERTACGDPDERTSVACAIRIIQQMMSNHSQVRGSHSLSARLAVATTDNYQRHGKKKSRNYPRRKEEPSAGKPTVNAASAKHKQTLPLIQPLATAS
jgi:hypothetical protein